MGTGEFTANYALTSSDGVHWTTQLLDGNSWWDSICYGNGGFLAVAYQSFTNSDEVISAQTVTYVEPILPLALQEAFNLPGAVGAQLDILGKYLGGQRINYLLDGTSYIFNDTEFTEYLQLLAARNGLSSDLGNIETFFHDYFIEGGNQVLLVYDFACMNMSFVYLAAQGAYPVLEAFITGGNLPKPTAVGASFIYNPTNTGFFAFRTYAQVAQPNTTGFSTYTGLPVGTFLTYSYSRDNWV